MEYHNSLLRNVRLKQDALRPNFRWSFPWADVLLIGGETIPCLTITVQKVGHLSTQYMYRMLVEQLVKDSSIVGCVQCLFYMITEEDLRYLHWQGRLYWKVQGYSHLLKQSSGLWDGENSRSMRTLMRRDSGFRGMVLLQTLMLSWHVSVKSVRGGMDTTHAWRKPPRFLPMVFLKEGQHLPGKPSHHCCCDGSSYWEDSSEYSGRMCKRYQ